MKQLKQYLCHLVQLRYQVLNLKEFLTKELTGLDSSKLSVKKKSKKKNDPKLKYFALDLWKRYEMLWMYILQIVQLY